MDEIFDSLANPHRRKILYLLSIKMSVGKIMAELPLSQPTVSSHLSLLRKAGLVSFEIKQRERLYFLNQEGLLKMKKSFDELVEHVLDIRVRMR